MDRSRISKRGEKVLHIHTRLHISLSKVSYGYKNQIDGVR